VNRESSIA